MWPPFQLVRWTPPDLAGHLATDEALLNRAEEDPASPPLLRFWEADRFAVVLGASGRIDRETHRDRCHADGVPILRRSSGGGTVVIGPGALNFTVVVPLDLDPGFAAVDVAQKTVLGRVADALRRAGPPVTVQGSGDLTVGPRKCSGSAQRRLRRTMMVHATLLYDFPLDRIPRYLPPPPRQPAYRLGRPHGDFVVNLPLGREPILGAISEGFRASQMVDDAEEAATLAGPVEWLVREKFADPQWIERL